MITGKKRTAENANSKDEPLKKKSLKTEKVDTQTKNYDKGDKKNKFSTIKKNPKKFGGNSKKFDPKSKGKFNGKNFNSKGNAKTINKQDEKTDWAQFKKNKKELKLKRKQTKDSYEISIDAKTIYEKLKCRRTEKKADLVEKLYNMLCGGDTIKKFVMAHDTARIIQCMLKFSSPSLRDQLSEKLLSLSVDMSISKYSHFCVLRMFKYGSPTVKSKLVDSFYGNIVRLACHNVSSKILDHVYHTVADTKQKYLMRQEFYSDLYKSSKDDNVKQLSDTYKDTPNMKTSILSSVKSNLEHVANKQLVDNSLVHAIMLEYIKECDDDKLEETVTMFAQLIPLMLSTKEGCQASIICFYKSTSKNRRAIIKAIKEHLVKICTHEHGHIFVLAVLNSLDDTKATKKAIFDTIYPELKTLMSCQWGRRVIDWLISPADTKGFHPSFIAGIEEGLQYGKKDKDVRRKEILEQIEGPLATAIVENPQFWLSNKHIGLVTANILRKISVQNFIKASTALASVIVDPNWMVEIEDESREKKTRKVHDIEKIIADATEQKKKQKALKTIEKNKENKKEDGERTEEDEDSESEDETKKRVSGIEEPGMHVVLKKIIKNDKEMMETETFGSLLVKQLMTETLEHWLTTNRGCFILLNIVENNQESTARFLRELLESVQTLLQEETSSGSKLLVKKLFNRGSL